MDMDERLRSTSDQMLENIEHLHAVESDKRVVPPGSREFKRLAREAERLANSLIAHAEAQSDLGAAVAEQDAARGTATPPIDATPRDVATILAEWRDAERRAAAAEPASDDDDAARKDVLRLRDEYQRAHRAASRARAEGAG